MADTNDLINRGEAILAVSERIRQIGLDNDPHVLSIRQVIRDLPSAQQWHVIEKRPMTDEERKERSERLGYDIEYEDAYIYSNLPDDLEEVSITWVNHAPEQYYAGYKDVPFVSSGVFYKGRWYWWSSTCADYLREYGNSPSDKMDDSIEVVAWMPFMAPYNGSE